MSKALEENITYNIKIIGAQFARKMFIKAVLLERLDLASIYRFISAMYDLITGIMLVGIRK